MKHSSILFSLILLSYLSYSQDTAKIKEIGITTANLNDFGITYRQGNSKSVWRFNAITSNISFSNESNSDDPNEISRTGFSLGFQAGKEWRKVIKPKFELRFGADIGFRYNTSDYERFNTDSLAIAYTANDKFYRPSINAVLGFNFVFSDNFLMGAEFQPSIYYTKSRSESYLANTQETNIRESETFGFGFSTNAIRMSLLYRF